VSLAAELGEGLPLFRAYLSADRKQLVFVWHHVISDLEGMFNKHAKHFFMEEGERTKFAWSSYNGEVLLYLHTDPQLIDKQRMLDAFRLASKEVLMFLMTKN
jgi:hypothetical protein